MKTEKKPSADEVEKELKRMKQKLNNENYALRKLLTNSETLKTNRQQKKSPGKETKNP